MPNQNSMRQYQTTLNNLLLRAGSNNAKEIFDYIKNSNVKDTTKLAYLNSILSLKKHGNCPVDGDVKEIEEMRDRLGVEIENKRSQNNLNENQTRVMDNVTMEDLEKAVQLLNYQKTENLNSLENYLLLKMLTTYPLRNDFMEVRIVKNIREAKASTDNVILIPKSGNATIYLREYKTAKSNGELIIEINDDISNDLRNLLKISPNRKYLFQTLGGFPLSSSDFTHRLKRLTSKLVGIPLSTTLIRKIYLTDKYADVKEEMREDAKIMGHSVATQQSSYVRNNFDN